MNYQAFLLLLPRTFPTEILNFHIIVRRYTNRSHRAFFFFTNRNWHLFHSSFSRCKIRETFHFNSIRKCLKFHRFLMRKNFILTINFPSLFFSYIVNIIIYCTSVYIEHDRVLIYSLYLYSCICYIYIYYYYYIYIYLFMNVCFYYIW